MVHSIGFYIYPDHQLLDLAGPLDVFKATTIISGSNLYDAVVLSREGGLVKSGSGAWLDTSMRPERPLDTIVAVGGSLNALDDEREAFAFQELSAGVRRIVSVCTGAFLLAEVGLLDGRRATTHWASARELQRRFPKVNVDAEKIFIQDGHIWSSAGVTAGIDLALALVEEDHGIELAKTVSRALVVYHRRPGGQAQSSALSEMDPGTDRIRLALTFVREHIGEPLPIERLAEASRLSPRQFGRAFREATGETPAKAVERLRVEAARLRLEESSEPVESISRLVGFADPERMRRAFIRRLGQAPQAIRRRSRELNQTR